MTVRDGLNPLRRQTIIRGVFRNRTVAMLTLLAETCAVCKQAIKR